VGREPDGMPSPAPITLVSPRCVWAGVGMAFRAEASLDIDAEDMPTPASEHLGEVDILPRGRGHGTRF